MGAIGFLKAKACLMEIATAFEGNRTNEMEAVGSGRPRGGKRTWEKKGVGTTPRKSRRVSCPAQKNISGIVWGR